MRMLISDDQTRPIAWECSKKEDCTPVGIIKLTFKQDLFDPARDNKELMIADYYSSAITPTPSTDNEGEVTPTPIYTIKYSGSPAIKVGGSAKTFSVNEPDDTVTYTWKVVGLTEDDYDLTDNTTSIKLKAAKNYNLIGTVFTLELYADGILSDSIECEVATL